MEKWDEEDVPSRAELELPRVARVVTVDMIVYCFDVLHCHLNNHSAPRPPNKLPTKH